VVVHAEGVGHVQHFVKDDKGAAQSWVVLLDPVGTREHPMWIWLVVAGLAALGELLSYDLFLAPVAAAGLVAALVTPISPFPVQIGVFAVLSLLGIVVLRPILRRALGLDAWTDDTGPVGHSHLVGRRGIVTQTVDADTGQIRIGSGEFWTARSFDPTETLATGAVVEVVVVDGLAALVDAVPHTTPVQSIESPTAIERGMES
jgi:membrane protein implicated in regulation of membrane protease activity